MNSADAPTSVRELIRQHYSALTPSERRFANALLDNYPAAGLASITRVAGNAGVSSPTVARTVKKLGFNGYPAFHKALLRELEATAVGPAQRRANWSSEAPETHLLNRFAQAVTDNLQKTFAHIDNERFDRATRQLADADCRLYIVGGRITQALADYAFTHFQAVRPRVTHMTSYSGTWPHYVLDMEPGETLLIFDIRRYETHLQRLAEMVRQRDVHVVLLTDQWGSPISSLADLTFNCWSEIPSGWDSSVATLMLLETLIASVQEQRWPDARDRYERLDALFNMTNQFRRFT